jgi:hypothetical protein
MSVPTATVAGAPRNDGCGPIVAAVARANDDHEGTIDAVKSDPIMAQLLGQHLDEILRRDLASPVQRIVRLGEARRAGADVDARDTREPRSINACTATHARCALSFSKKRIGCVSVSFI